MEEEIPEERILGIDLTDSEAAAALSDSGETFHVPTAICRDKKHDLWYIGEEAYEKALAGKGILTDQLLKLAEKNGTATIRGVRYQVSELLSRFLSLLKENCEKAAGGKRADAVVIVLADYRKDAAQTLLKSLLPLGFPENRTFCISREESFIYYVMSQPREVRNSEVGLFDLSEQSLIFYELTHWRDRKKLYVKAEREKLEEAFTLSVLETASGKKLADRILTSAAERLFQSRLFTGVFLTGRGFRSYDWAPDFMKFVCARRRRVFLDEDLFAKGALVRGQSLMSGAGDPGFVPLCRGRSQVNLTLAVRKNGQDINFPLISAGDPIGGSSVSLRLLPDESRELKLQLDPLRAGKVRVIRVPLSFLPERDPRSCFVDFTAEFRDERTMTMSLRSAGFGELFPAGDGGEMRQEVALWE